MNSLDTLVLDVRAGTDGFAADVAQMRSSFDGILVEGFSRGGTVLERSLLSALRSGSLGFDDLKRTALATMDAIAAQALRTGLGALGGGAGQGGGLASGIGSALGALLGLPGRATGGPVAPGRPYLVGERGPEVFMPTSAGSIDTGGMGQARAVNVSIRVVAPAGSGTPESLRRSSRQVAAAVRRALAES